MARQLRETNPCAIAPNFNICYKCRALNDQIPTTLSRTGGRTTQGRIRQVIGLRTPLVALDRYPDLCAHMQRDVIWYRWIDIVVNYE